MRDFDYVLTIELKNTKTEDNPKPITLTVYASSVRGVMRSPDPSLGGSVFVGSRSGGSIAHIISPADCDKCVAAMEKIAEHTDSSLPPWKHGTGD